jgi:ABC-2 type transport system permease protein
MSLFFASLVVMIAFSTGILAYGNLYSSQEVRFLLTTPVRDERVFLHKFQEAIFLSTWAFLLLGSPVLLAYGLAEGAGWWYYGALLPYALAFAYIPGCLGAIACLLIVRYLPTRRVKLFGVGGAVVVVAVAAIAWPAVFGFRHAWLTPGWFEEALARVRFAEYRLLPNWWLSSGLLEAAHGSSSSMLGREALWECLLFLALLTSNALMLHLLTMACARRVFRTGYTVLHADRSSDRRISAAHAEPWLTAPGSLLPERLRLLVLKDLKLFRRDPVQWSQFIVFFALLVLYFFSTRKLSFDVEYAAWVNMISFLNLAIIGLILSTFTTRFIFPLISIEGRRFWILGLLPVRRDMILWSKFLFAVFGSWIPCSLLAVLSDVMLGVTADLMLVHLLICALLCLGLSGIAVGLGARFPNFRHESPARIAAGFGGTLTLVISTTYIMAIVVLAAVPCHFYSALATTAEVSEWFSSEKLSLWWSAGLGASIVLGITATVVPLRLGLQWFRRIEF